MIEGINHWPDYVRFRDQFEAAMDPRFYSIFWLDDQIRYNKFRLWASEDAAIIAEIKTYPTNAKEVHGVLAAGELAEIVKLIVKAEEWGVQQGCISGSISSHPAWQRIMKSHGYEPSQLLIRKDLC